MKDNTTKQSMGKARNTLIKLAWLSTVLALVIGVSHVRSFPSYNIAVAISGLYASSQEDTELLLKSTSICSFVCVLSIFADAVFCFLWAKEVRMFDMYILYIMITYSTLYCIGTAHIHINDHRLMIHTAEY